MFNVFGPPGDETVGFVYDHGDDAFAEEEAVFAVAAVGGSGEEVVFLPFV